MAKGYTFGLTFLDFQEFLESFIEDFNVYKKGLHIVHFLVFLIDNYTSPEIVLCFPSTIWSNFNGSKSYLILSRTTNY